MSGNYDDILHLPHHTSKAHPRMPRQDRAAQFAPFAALTGYEDVILEAGRLTDRRVELDAEVKAELDARLRLATELDAEVMVTWFQPDSRKCGGSYITTTGHIKRVDELRHVLIMRSGMEIPVDDVIDIQGSVFNALL